MENKCAFARGKRVLFISPQPFMADRGSPLRVRATLRALVAMGFEVDLLALPFGVEEDIPGVCIHRSIGIPGIKRVPIGPSLTKLLLDVPLFIKAHRMLKLESYFAIHAVEEAAFIASKISRKSGIPFIMDMHSSMIEQLKEYNFIGKKLLINAFSVLERKSLETASGVLTVCDDLTQYAQTFLNGASAITANDLALESSGVVDEVFLARLKRDLNPDARKVVVYSGNLKSYQGVPLLIESMSHVIRSCDNSKKAPLLVIVGGGEDEKSQLRECVQLASSLGISKNVKFVGLRPSNEMGNYLAFADVLVSPRLTGCNTPLKIYSYLQAKRPIVATRIRSHTQALNDEVAFLCKPKPKEFGEAIIDTLSDDPDKIELRGQRVARGAVVIEEKYSWKQFTASLEKLYQSVDGKRHHKPVISADFQRKRRISQNIG